MSDQLDLITGGVHTTTDTGRKLTERQQLALDYVRAHAPVPSDELGALLHEERQARGGRGHSREERCEYCGEEGSGMGRRLRELGLVRHATDQGWYPAEQKRPRKLKPGVEGDYQSQDIPF